MQTTTPPCIDLNSDSDTETRASSTTTKQQQVSKLSIAQQKGIAKPKNKKSHKDQCCDGDINTGRKAEFIDHVVMIWLNRARRGNLRVEMPDSILKDKAEETARILDRYYTFHSNAWLQSFKKKLKKQKSAKYRDAPKNQSMLIEHIVNDEMETFFKNHNNEDDSGSRRSSDAPQDVCDEFFDSPISDYNEALECLKMVEEHALCMRNYRAVGLIAQIENIMKNDPDP